MPTARKALIGLVALVAIVLAGSFAYSRLADAPDAFDQADLEGRLDTTTTPIAPTSPTPGSTATTTSPAPEGLDGTWSIAAASEVGYRVEETVNGFATTANGRTTAVTGSITIAGFTVTAGSFSVDLSQVASDESRRDGQFRGRIMDVAQYPTADFALTSPLEFGSADATTATATGDLTLHGVTRSVTFDVATSMANGRIGVLGQIPVVFADYGIPNPSFASIRTEDVGLLEFILVLERA